jgi:serine/threonine protein kinase
MWSVGCILCEFFGRKPIFKGKDHITQLTSIIQVLGTPPRKLILEIGSEKVSKKEINNIEILLTVVLRHGNFLIVLSTISKSHFKIFIQAQTMKHYLY